MKRKKQKQRKRPSESKGASLTLANGLEDDVP